MLDLINKNNNIIVNTDIDGILSAFVLCKYCGCKIVGFCNSKDCVWWREDKIASIFDAVYIDMYVPKPDVLTIDQHIIAYNLSSLSKIATFGTKLNPNIENPRTYQPTESYSLKYPFGTIHYILAKLGKAWIVAEFDMNKVISEDYADNLTIGDFILRADDAFTTTVASNYKKNAREWWDWLERESNSSQNIKGLRKYIAANTIKPLSRMKEAALAKKDAFTRYFKAQFGGKKDGGFTYACDEQGLLLPNVKNYISHFFSSLGDVSDITLLEDTLNRAYKCSKGKAYHSTITASQADELLNSGTIDGNNVFSYAFTGAWKGPHFAYTVLD